MLHKKLKMLRENSKLTQDDVARVLNIARGTYTHYEIGKRKPDYDTLCKLADFFNVSIDYLLGRTDSQAVFKGDKNLVVQNIKFLMENLSLDEFIDKVYRKTGLKLDKLLMNKFLNFKTSVDPGTIMILSDYAEIPPELFYKCLDNTTIDQARAEYRESSKSKKTEIDVEKYSSIIKKIDNNNLDLQIVESMIDLLISQKNKST